MTLLKLKHISSEEISFIFISGIKRFESLWVSSQWIPKSVSSVISFRFIENSFRKNNVALKMLKNEKLSQKNKTRAF